MGNSKIIKVNTDDLLSVQEAATQLKRPRLTLYRWIQKGQLLAIRLGGILFVPVSEVERLRAENGHRQDTPESTG